MQTPDTTSREFRVYSQRHGRKKYKLTPRQAKRLSKKMLRTTRSRVEGIH